ncbi:MAG: nuclear transport factor 2 family protein [Anaerolineales bacterium]|jgi:predicted ester cyclase
MASRIEILKAWNAARNADPASPHAASYLEEDFQNTGRDGRILMNKRAYLEMADTLASAFSGLKFEFTHLQDQGDSILATFRFEGIHTSRLDLTAIGMGVIPPSGRQVVSPESIARFSFRGDKIAGIQEISGGIEAFAESQSVRTRPL